MLQGQHGSIEIIRFLKPFSRRNLSAAPTRYANEKDGRKRDGILSLLKDIFVKTEHKNIDHEARTALDTSEMRCQDQPNGTSNFLSNVNNHRLINAYVKISNLYRHEITEAIKNSRTPIQRKLHNYSSSTTAVKFTDHLTSSSKRIPKMKFNRRRKLHSDDHPLRKIDFGVHAVNYANWKPTYRSWSGIDLCPPRYPSSFTSEIDKPIRTIVSCAPRDIKPPIREPNMPEKRDKKDEKKEKKQKTPVIRTDSDSREHNSSNEMSAKEEDRKNTEKNVHYPWGLRNVTSESEDDRKNENSVWGGSSRITSMDRGNFHDNYPVDFQMSAVGDSNLESTKGTQFGVSSSSRSEKKEANKGDLVDSMAKLIDTADSKGIGGSEDIGNVETLKKMLETAPTSTKETAEIDEDYNIPSELSYDAEISAWKDLVLRSKVPLPPPEEETIPVDANARLDMLSIRPEPPQPKLDIQAIPSSENPIDDEDDHDLPKADYKPIKSLELKHGSTDYQKMDIKKLHTGVQYIAITKRDHAGHSLMSHGTPYDSSIMTKSVNYSSNSEKTRKPVDLKETNQFSSAVKEATGRNLHDHRTVLPTAQPHTYRTPSENSRVEADTDFAEGLSTIADKELEVSLDNTHQETQPLSNIPGNAAQKSDLEDSLTDEEAKNNFNYAGPYENDFYSGYESTKVEAAAQESFKERKRDEQSVAEDEAKLEDKKEELDLNIPRNKDGTVNYVLDGDYIRVPGDPYPYSREHFYKWRLPKEEAKLSSVLNCSPAKSRSSKDSASSDRGSNVREMSHYAKSMNKEDEGRRGRRTLSRKRRTSRFSSSSLHQRLVPDCLREIPKTGVSEDSTEDQKHLETEGRSWSLPTVNGLEKLEDKQRHLGDSDEEALTRVETIQPEMNPSKAGDTNAAENMQKNKGSKLIQKPKLKENSDVEGAPEVVEEDVYNVRMEQLSSITKEEAEKIYEQKNYVYLRREDMKNLQIKSKSGAESKYR